MLPSFQTREVARGALLNVNRVCLLSTAQAILASLLATATETTLPCDLVSRSLIQSPDGRRSRLTRYTTDRAPWMKRRRRYSLPRLLMPSSFVLPPVERCWGTKPSQVANSRPFLKAEPFPIAATIAVAPSGPIPGIVSKH